MHELKRTGGLLPLIKLPPLWRMLGVGGVVVSRCDAALKGWPEDGELVLRSV